MTIKANKFVIIFFLLFNLWFKRNTMYLLPKIFTKKIKKVNIVKVAFCSVHNRRLWKWRSAMYMVAVCKSGVLQCTWSPFVEVALCSVHGCRLWKQRSAVYIVAVCGSKNGYIFFRFLFKQEIKIFRICIFMILKNLEILLILDFFSRMTLNLSK